MKITLLVSSFIIIVILSAEGYRESFDMAWHAYQNQYKQVLMQNAKTEQERITADNYTIQMRQNVLPKLNRFDRCVTCHVAMEDDRMSDMANPLKSHPGNYLETHDVNKVGCTLCHDGQGRAITMDDAHAQTKGKYWEKPMLSVPFLEANCARCHMNELEQPEHYNRGKALVQSNGCKLCHMIQGKGGEVGPDLSDISEASFHLKASLPENRDAYYELFDGNVNLGYLYESVKYPAAQGGEDTQMLDFEFSDTDLFDVMVYLKSLSSKRRVLDVGAE